MSLLSLRAAPPEVTEAPPPAGWPLLRLGFRPFYLDAALFAVVAMPLWIALYLGQVALTLAVPPLLWHAHEMLFGFAIAVIVGFLLTAGKAWTGLATPRGALLGALALLWACARVAAVVGPYAIYALLDVVLLPLVAALMVDLLVRAGNRRNLPLAGILVLLSLANGAFHLAVIGVVAMAPLATLHAGLALIVIIECVIAGRVIPAFTMSATPGLKLAVRPAPERATLPITALALASWVFAPSATNWGWGSGAALALAAAMHLARQWQWRPTQTRSRPILWILHAAYAWIALGLGLLALAQFGLIGVSAGVHALAVGATGGLIIGMITRTARGHTGRPLKASKPEVLAYGLVMAAAALRVLGPLAMPRWMPHLLVCAALAWCAAFAIYLVIYAPWLIGTRQDGKDG
ncbi:MAG: short-chain dehydrogenase [Comamonadaceae bacterium SCN 68-20]|nr:MAG: short-chain dehydrogenase [Comamonadaceae bacterium SCN 68-20]